jgi:hypothetical protein
MSGAAASQLEKPNENSVICMHLRNSFFASQVRMLATQLSGWRLVRRLGLLGSVLSGAGAISCIPEDTSKPKGGVVVDVQFDEGPYRYDDGWVVRVLPRKAAFALSVVAGEESSDVGFGFSYTDEVVKLIPEAKLGGLSVESEQPAVPVQLIGRALPAGPAKVAVIVTGNRFLDQGDEGPRPSEEGDNGAELTVLARHSGRNVSFAKTVQVPWNLLGMAVSARSIAIPSSDAIRNRATVSSAELFRGAADGSTGPSIVDMFMSLDLDSDGIITFAEYSCFSFKEPTAEKAPALDAWCRLIEKEERARQSTSGVRVGLGARSFFSGRWLP